VHVVDLDSASSLARHTSCRGSCKSARAESLWMGVGHSIVFGHLARVEGRGAMKNTVYAYSIIQELKKDISDFVAYKERCQFGCDGERAGTFCWLESWFWND